MQAVEGYKELSEVERGFRELKDLIEMRHLPSAAQTGAGTHSRRAAAFAFLLARALEKRNSKPPGCGTGGAVRYRLPKLPSVPAGSAAAECTKNGRAFCAQTDVYGYLLVTVNARGKPGAIELRFKEIKAENVPAETRQKFTADTMNVCFEGNKQMTPAVDATQYLPDGPCPY